MNTLLTLFKFSVACGGATVLTLSLHAYFRLDEKSKAKRRLFDLLIFVCSVAAIATALSEIISLILNIKAVTEWVCSGDVAGSNCKKLGLTVISFSKVVGVIFSIIAISVACFLVYWGLLLATASPFLALLEWITLMTVMICFIVYSGSG